MDEIMKDKVIKKTEEAIRFLNDIEAPDFDRWYGAISCLSAAYNLSVDERDNCPKSYTKIAEDAVSGAKDFLEELIEDAKNNLELNKDSAKTYSELAEAAMTAIEMSKIKESPEDKDSFQLTRDIKRYQHQRLIVRLEKILKSNETVLNGFSKQKNVPTSGVFNCMRDVEELKETLNYVKNMHPYGLY